jgi:hypothetical protein
MHRLPVTDPELGLTALAIAALGAILGALTAVLRGTP